MPPIDPASTEADDGQRTIEVHSNPVVATDLPDLPDQPLTDLNRQRTPETDTVGHRPSPSDTDRQQPTLTDDGGHRPTLTEADRRERTERHTLNIQEVMRQFRDAGVPRSERTVLRWCQPDQFGGRRLDGVKDMNEGRYFITPESVADAIKEEQAKEARSRQDNPDSVSVTHGKSGQGLGGGSEQDSNDAGRSMADSDVRKLETKIRDLEITNAAKDHVIDRYETERDKFVDQLMASSRQVGELEQRLLQLDAPKANE